MITESPAFSTGDKDAVLFAGVTNSSFDFSVEREKPKQVGTQSVAFNQITRHPNISLEVDYLFCPALLNERSLDFSIGTGSPYAFSGFRDKSYNFCYLHNPDQEKDAKDEYVAVSPNFSGYDVVSIGNAYLNNYSVNYSIGQIPTVKTSYQASNIKYETLTGNFWESPAINLQSGNNANVGNVNVSGFYDVPSRSEPLLLNPKDINVTLQNLQIGGQNLSGYHFIQNLGIDISIPRVDLYGLGSDYVYDRKIQFPLNGNVSVSSLVSGFDAGQASGMLKSETGYNFEIYFIDEGQNSSGKLIIENAKLEGFSYSESVNENVSFDAQFSFDITENQGLRISGDNLDYYVWSTLPLIWNEIVEIWSEV